jgi:branched-chain amino acid transport system permease protein
MGYPDFAINYWVALIVVPLVVGALGIVIERTMLRHLYKLDHLYGLLLTFRHRADYRRSVSRVVWLIRKIV